MIRVPTTNRLDNEVLGGEIHVCQQIAWPLATHIEWAPHCISDEPPCLIGYPNRELERRFVFSQTLSPSPQHIACEAIAGSPRTRPPCRRRGELPVRHGIRRSFPHHKRAGCRLKPATRPTERAPLHDANLGCVFLQAHVGALLELCQRLVDVGPIQYLVVAVLHLTPNILIAGAPLCLIGAILQ